MTLDKHKFIGTLNICIKCLKPPTDDIHEVLEHIHVCETCAKQVVCLDNTCTKPKTIVCEFCSNIAPEISPSYILDTIISKTEREDNINHVCPGHKCPKCISIWRHDYACESQEHEGLCTNCAQATAALINRPANIEDLIKPQKSLTNCEAVSLALQYREFAVKNFTLDDKGLPIPESEAREKILTHIQNLRVIQEKSRINERESLMLLAEVDTQEAMKISPDQVEDFKRLAAKNKRRDSDKEMAKSAKKAEKKEKYKDEVAALLAKMGKKVDPKLLDLI